MNRRRLHHLHQRIGHIHVGHKRSSRHGPGGVHGIRGSRVHQFHVTSRPGNRDFRGIDQHLRDLLSRHKITGHAGMHFNFTAEPRIKVQVQLPRQHLHDTHVAWRMDLT